MATLDGSSPKSHRSVGKVLAILLALVVMPLVQPLRGERIEAGEPDAGEVAASGVSLSLVKISTTSASPNYRIPWSPGTVESGTGAGFVIKGARIMTNAHVVSRATFISVEREGDPRRYPARTLFVAHDSDLALLTVDDPRFFKGMQPLEFGGVPEIESTVFAYGYPLGGDRMSVTRGVVSRIDFQTYSHTGIDAHLAVQIDAAINPGNSGGPVLQDGRVVGVAFQGYSGDVAQNVGYIIPTPVISRFLKDIEDGSYDRYVDLALAYAALHNPAKRRSLGLADDGIGVFVTEVFAGGSADGHVKKGDVILSIDGYPVKANGFVALEGAFVEMPEVVERKLKGEKVALGLYRDGRRVEVSFPLRGIWPAQMNGNQYDSDPPFVLYGGLLFQPLSRGLMEAYEFSDLRLRYFYERFVPEQIYLERPEVVVLSAVLPDTSNTYLADLPPAIVDSVDGKPIKTLEELAAALDAGGPQIVISTLGSGRPIIIERAAAAAARERIIETYGVNIERRLLPAQTF